MAKDKSKSKKKRGPSKPPPGVLTRREQAVINRIKEEAALVRRVRKELTDTTVSTRAEILASYICQKGAFVRVAELSDTMKEAVDEGLVKSTPKKLFAFVPPGTKFMVAYLIPRAIQELKNEGVLPLALKDVEQEILRRRAAKKSRVA